MILLFWLSFWVFAVIGFIILMVVWKRTDFRLGRMGRYALATLSSSASVMLLQYPKMTPQGLPLTQTQTTVQWFGVAVFTFWAWIALVEAFEAEGHWKKRQERKAAERQ